MSETTGLKKLLYKTLKHERDYEATGESPKSSACLFSYYTTEEIRMNVYITIIDTDDKIRNISFYLYDYSGNNRSSIGNVIRKIYRSDINASYNLYEDKDNSKIKSLYINYDKTKKIAVCLEILSGNIHELNFDRLSSNDTTKFSGQDLFNIKAINATMLNVNINSSIDEPWYNDNIYNTNMLFTHNPFQIHNEYVTDYSGIRFGSGSKKIDTNSDGTNDTESGNAYINIYTGDDKDPIYVTQYTGSLNGNDAVANQITLLDENGNTKFNDSVIIKKDGDTLFFNPSNSKTSDRVAILNKSDDYNPTAGTGYNAGIYLNPAYDKDATSKPDTVYITVDGKIYAKTEITTDGNIYAGSYIKLNSNASYTNNVINTQEYNTTFYGGKIELTNHNNSNITYNSSYKNISIDSSTGCIEIGNETTDTRCVKIDGFANSGKHGRIQLFNDGNECININGSDGYVTALSFNASSDKRLKKNIVDFTPQKSILDLPIKEFDYITTEKHAIGCLAQDLQEICPEIVDTDDKGYLSIQESKIVYLLLDEVKKLRKELDELKGRE